MVLLRFCIFILNAILVLGINVPSDNHNKTSDVCMPETLLLRSCTKICGDTRCDMHSYCGEDKRCLHCSDAVCKSPPIGCEISCAWRFTDKIYYNLSRKKGHQQNSLFDNKTLPILLAFSTIVNVLLGCCHCRKRLMKLTACILQERKHVQQPEDKLSPIVVNNSNLESQTTRLLVTGQTIEMSKDKTFSTVVEEETSTLRGDSLGATE